jgi:hypothetical protein
MIYTIFPGFVVLNNVYINLIAIIIGRRVSSNAPFTVIHSSLISIIMQIANLKSDSSLENVPALDFCVSTLY